MDADRFPRHARSWHPDVTALVPTHRADVTWRTTARNLLGMLLPRRGMHAAARAWFGGAALVVAAAAGLAISLTSPAPHAVASSSSGPAALGWAESHAGAWYQWGGTGPGFDCSGLVYEAYLHEGINIGRSTYDMLASRHLVQVSAGQRQRGDLAFFGTGHVELVTSRGTFGALKTGTQVGWHQITQWWHPSAYFRVR